MSGEVASTRVILVRHGETCWNTEGRYQGQLDSPLTEEGHRQAEAIAARLAQDRIDGLYASDLGRARRTAEPIAAATGVPLYLDARLRERHFGLFHGQTPAVLRRQHPADYTQFSQPDADYRVPLGESLRQVHDRAVACLQDLHARHAGQRVALVTHGGVLAALLKYVLGLPLAAARPFRVFNAAYNVIHHTEGRWLLEVLGDVSHLQTIDGSDDVV